MEWDLPRGTGTARDDTVALTQWLDHADLKRFTDPDAYPRFVLSSNSDDLGDGLFLGLTEKGEPVSIIDDRHCITVAGSRSGKGRSAIVPNLLLWKGSAIVIDPKGENASLTAQHRAERLGQHVVVLDPFAIVAESAAAYRQRFNPLLELDPHDDEFVDEAVLLADSIVATRADARDPHWDESARELIKGLILYVRTTASRRPDQANLLTLRRILTSPARLQAALTEMSASLSAAFGVSAAAAESFLAKPESERMSVLSNARRHTEFLDSPAMARCLSWEDLQPGESLEQVGLAHLKRCWHTDHPHGMTVFLCLPARHMLTYGRWLRMLTSLALNAMERTPKRDNMTGRLARDVLFVMDEFAVLGHLPAIENAAGQMAGFGVKLWPILQDLSQLQALYDKRWETFLANAGVHQFFGNADLTTLKHVSDRLGVTAIENTSVNLHSPTTSQSASPSGFGITTSAVPLLHQDEVRTLFSRDKQRQIVLFPEHDPVWLYRANYDLHPLFVMKGSSIRITSNKKGLLSRFSRG